MIHNENLQIKGLVLPKVRVESTGVFFPEQVVTSDDLLSEIDSEKNYGWPTDLISRHIGIKERRMADGSCLPSDLAIPAAKMAIRDCVSLNPDDIGMVIFCGIERDQPEPATAHTIQNALGLSADHAFDIANACFGFIHGMQLASNYIKLGEVKKALIVTGEVPTKIQNGVLDLLKKGLDKNKAKKLLGALTVGDAGGAAILSACHAGDHAGFDIFNNTSDSKHINKCIYRCDKNGIPRGQMDMPRINRVAHKIHERIIDSTLAAMKLQEFDWVLAHQTGAHPFEQLSHIRGVQKEKMVKTFDLFGNLTTATFPVNFNFLEKAGRVNKGDKIGGLFAGSGLAIGQFGYTY